MCRPIGAIDQFANLLLACQVNVMVVHCEQKSWLYTVHDLNKNVGVTDKALTSTDTGACNVK